MLLMLIVVMIYMPVPISVIFRGLSPASSVIETVAVLVFTPPGWKVMTMLQVFPTASGEDEA
jgi:hypothetical protein